MGKSKYYLVLDTETVSDGARIPFDIAWTVINRQGETMERSNYFTAEILDTPTGLYLTNTDRFSRDKMNFYKDTIENNPEILLPFEEIQNEFWHALRTWDNPPVVAYNAKFDVTVLNNYSNALGCGNFFPEQTKIWDLWNIALHSLCNSKNYVEWSLLNDFITEAGNIQSSAEAVFNYLIKDGKFVESHTALSDTEIEAKILYACFKRHKKLETDYAGAMFHHPIWKNRLKLS